MKEEMQVTASDPKFNVSINVAQCLVEILNKDKEEDLKKEDSIIFSLIWV